MWDAGLCLVLVLGLGLVLVLGLGLILDLCLGLGLNIGLCVGVNIDDYENTNSDTLRIFFHWLSSILYADRSRAIVKITHLGNNVFFLLF